MSFFWLWGKQSPIGSGSLLAPSSFSYFKIFLAIHPILRWASQPAIGVPVLVLGAGTRRHLLEEGGPAVLSCNFIHC